MANHDSSKKRIRQDEKKRVHNKYYHKSMRSALKKFRASEDKEEVTGMVSGLVSLIDKLVKKNIIHKNKGANLKSSVSKKVSEFAK